MARNEITWGRRMRPRKADKGHSVRRTGRRPEGYNWRHYIECQCGSTYSAATTSEFVDSPAWHLFERHLRNVGVR